jgi:hypothetical protein
VELPATTHYRKCLPEPIFSSLLTLHCNSQRVLDQSEEQEQEEDPKPGKKNRLSKLYSSREQASSSQGSQYSSSLS